MGPFLIQMNIDFKRISGVFVGTFCAQAPIQKFSDFLYNLFAFFVDLGVQVGARRVGGFQGKSVPWRLRDDLEEAPFIFLHSQSRFLPDLGSIFNDFSFILGSNFINFVWILE